MDLVIANICKIGLSNSKYVKITGDNTRQNIEYISSENAFLTFCISLIVVHTHSSEIMILYSCMDLSHLTKVLFYLLAILILSNMAKILWSLDPL
jgi:hypothetical protein